MEKFAIRFEPEKFMTALYSFKATVEKSEFEAFRPSVNNIAKDLRYLGNLCKEQSLTVMGKTSPYKDLMRNANYIDVLVQSALIDKSKHNFDVVKRMFLNDIDIFIDNMVYKFGGITSQGKSVDATYGMNTTDMLKGIDNSITNLNATFERELAYIKANKPLENNTPVVIMASVGVEKGFKNIEAEHTVVRTTGVKYSGNRVDAATPITVLHNQTLLMIKLRALKFHFRKEPLSLQEKLDREAAVLKNIKKSNFKDSDYDMSDYVQGGLLISKLFKGYVFVWFMDIKDKEKLGSLPENSASLMWS